MENWQFLLQKEEDELTTDRSASSLLKASNNSTIALEEGRYRIVAHSDRSNIDVEIDISHQIVNTGKSLRRSQKRSRSTNEAGLVVILPFTDLQPGWWEIQCSGEILSGEDRSFWQKKLEMQVYPKSDRAYLDVARSQDDEESREEEQGSKGAEEQGSKKAEELRSRGAEEQGSTGAEVQEVEAKNFKRKYQEIEIAQPSLTTSSLNVNLFDPKKVSQESIQTQPLTGQILPPKMPANDDDINKQPIQEYPRSPKTIELPKVNLPKIEPISFSQLPLPTQQTKDELNSSDSSGSDRVEGLNLQQRFWSLINSLASDSPKETEMNDEE